MLQYSTGLISAIIIYILLLVSCIVSALHKIRNPSRALSWVLVILLMPFFGMFLYFLLGRKIRQERYFMQKKPFYNKKQELQLPEELPEKYRLMTLLSKNKTSAFSVGNEVKLLIDGVETFEALFTAFRNAKKSIHLDFYIIEDGENLNRCIEIFKEKIQEGVVVRIIYDGLGSLDLADTQKSRIREIGVELKQFMPFHIFKYIEFSNYRNHRKIVVIDNQVAFTGGYNLTDKYHKIESSVGLWRDVFVRIEGPAAVDLNKIFFCDWFYAGGVVPENLEAEPQKQINVGSTTVQLIASGPDTFANGILQEYFTLITDAEDYIYIVSPYFVPGDAIMMALKTSAFSGVDVRLMLPYNPDYKWLRHCMFSYFEELLAYDVKIYLHHKGFLHGKVLVSDDLISSVGTANIDERSFVSNFEVNAVIYSKDIAIELKTSFLDDIKDCELLSLNEFPNRPDRSPILESLARLSSPIL